MSAPRETVHTLRLKYNVAWAAHEQRERLLTEARRCGGEIPTALVEEEASTRLAMEDARERLRVAMTDSITGHHRIVADHSEGPLFEAERPPDFAPGIAQGDKAKP